jgi:hypothetical protein
VKTSYYFLRDPGENVVAEYLSAHKADMYSAQEAQRFDNKENCPGLPVGEIAAVVMNVWAANR